MGIECWPNAEERMDHHLHLMFFRAPISNDADFDLERRILENFEASFGSKQQRDPADMRKFQRRLRIDGVKDLFDCKRIRLKLAYNVAKPGSDLLEPSLESIARTGPNYSS